MDDTRAQRHALLFRRLAERCGGIPRIVELGATRVRQSHLYRYADPNSRCFAPVDVIEDLELLCGEPVYTAGLMEGLPASRLVGDLLQETCETSVGAAALLQLVMQAKASSAGVTPRMRTAILAAVELLREELRQVESAACQPASSPSEGGAS